MFQAVHHEDKITPCPEPIKRISLWIMLASLLLLQSVSAPVTAHTGVFRNPRLTESSGVAVSRAHPGVLWTHNDSGDGPYLYATDLRGTDRGAIRVAGANAVDWEDIALGPCPSGPGDCIYIADTGDNLERRANVALYAVPEPDPPSTPADTQRVSAAAHRVTLRYPDGAHDVEAIYISPRDSAVYLVSKGRSGGIHLYRVGRDAWFSDRPSVATLVQTLPIDPDRSAGRLVTGAAMRLDGAVVAIRTYVDIRFFTPGPGGRLRRLGTGSCSIVGLQRGGEAVDFLNDSTLVLTGEGGRRRPGRLDTVRCGT